jgi:FtsP/CotA-like multicopper oxidase with cupredoxin domain
MKVLSILLFASQALYAAANPIPNGSESYLVDLRKRSACAGNTPTTRHTWCNFNINTDYTTVVPNTGVTREYSFNLEEVTIAPDGFSRPALAINGQMPGPTIYANWGDTVVVHVTNSLKTWRNGTTVHFHGIRQNYTNQNDGVAAITQCPTPPGSTYTYTWRAIQYGSSWYHAHIGMQAYEGLYGGIVINGPASSNYDVDKGILFLTDWSHSTADVLYAQAQNGGPPSMATGLINGTNVSNSGGKRFKTRFTSGQSYRFRLVNGAIDTHFKFSIDHHVMTVIANDFVPIQPYLTKVLDIAIGQIYFLHSAWRCSISIADSR